MSRDQLIEVAAARQAVIAGYRDAGKWIGRAAAVTVAGLAGIAGALSYSHMRQLAEGRGQGGWHAHAFPLSVDGIEIVASLVLLAERRAGRRPGMLPWAALIIGTAGSLAANVATAGPGTVSRVIAGWPAVALLIAVKLLSGMLGQYPASAVAVGSSDSLGDQDAGDAPRLTAVPDPSNRVVAARPQSAVVPPGSGAVNTTSPGTGTGSRTILGSPGIAELLPAARAARDNLQGEGHRLTRDALAARLRETGCRVGNSRLTALLQALRSESPTPPLASANTAT